jgi:hypothetical protein
MTIFHIGIPITPRNSPLAEAFLSNNQPSAPEFLIATVAISEFDSSRSKQSRRQISNSYKNGILDSQQLSDFVRNVATARI